MLTQRWTFPFDQHWFENRLSELREDACFSSVAQIGLDKPAQAAPADRRRDGARQIELDVDSTRRQRIETSDGPLWLEGNAILCACPDCAAPMSLRLSLAMANCWRCESCVELTPAQRFAVEQALGRATVDPARPLWRARDEATSPIQQRSRSNPTPSWAGYDTGRGRKRYIVRQKVNFMPAWLVSFLFHLILLMLLALIFFPYVQRNEAITITTYVDSRDEVGGHVAQVNIEHDLSDDLLPEPLMEMGEKELRRFKQRAEQDARELQVDDAPLASLPSVESVRRDLTTATGHTRSLVARDPRVRADIVERAGGSTVTEAAVSRGLRWLASVQNKDGSWSLSDYEQSDRPRNSGDVAGTALALLPFLGAGQTHEFGVYKSNVAKGLQWLVDHQKSNGDLRDAAHGEYGMYSHGQAAIVLIEAYAMTGDQKLHQPAQRAIAFIENAQHEGGGWRYRPKEPGDTSVLGWQLMALQSARASGSGLIYDEATLKLADYYLDVVSKAVSPGEDSELRDRYRQSGVLYRYQPGREPTPAITAEAILCRMYLGWNHDDPRLAIAIDWLTRYHLPGPDSEFNVYYWYYAMQALHHYGGPKWESWNRAVRDLLVLSQETRGRHPGSWDPDQDVWGRRAGRIYVTSMAVCTLEVYYRHLPLFKPLDLD